MAKTVYKVYDATGIWLRAFNTYKEAQTFRIAMGRYDWPIKTVVTK